MKCGTSAAQIPCENGTKETAGFSEEVSIDAIVRALAVYLFLVAMFRIAGRRTMMQLTSFDLILLLIISEATQNAMIGDDYSVTNGFLVIVTLIAVDIGFAQLKHRSPFFERWLDGTPLVIVDNGVPLLALMNKARVVKMT